MARKVAVTGSVLRIMGLYELVENKAGSKDEVVATKPSWEERKVLVAHLRLLRRPNTRNQRSKVGPWLDAVLV